MIEDDFLRITALIYIQTVVPLKCKTADLYKKARVDRTLSNTPEATGVEVRLVKTLKTAETFRIKTMGFKFFLLVIAVFCLVSSEAFNMGNKRVGKRHFKVICASFRLQFLMFPSSISDASDAFSFRALSVVPKALKEL